MVGKTHVTETPEFDGIVSYMVVNPSWHIPDSIAIRDYLPKLQKDPMVLKNQGIDLMTRGGTVINPKLVDFTQYTPENFPFRIKQRPSDDNALGTVKFMFPNRFSVYMHDTPHRELFARDVRAFSNGCIRLEKPRELAEILLAGQVPDPAAAFAGWLATKKERQRAPRAHDPGAHRLPHRLVRRGRQRPLPARRLRPRRAGLRGDGGDGRDHCRRPGLTRDRGFRYRSAATGGGGAPMITIADLARALGAEAARRHRPRRLRAPPSRPAPARTRSPSPWSRASPTTSPRAGARAAILWPEADWQALGLAPRSAPRAPATCSPASAGSSSAPPEIAPGIHPTAVIDPTATLGAGAAIGPFVVDRRPRPHRRARAHLRHVSIAEDAVLGDDALLLQGVRIGARVRIGDRFIAQPGAVLGGDGFSFVTPTPGIVEEARATGAITAREQQDYVRINSLGAVVIGDDVEVGANSCIDRGTIADTAIGDGTKIDNLVQLGHNVRVGRTCLICGQAAVAGSTVIGDRVVLGGEARRRPPDRRRQLGHHRQLRRRVERAAGADHDGLSGGADGPERRDVQGAAPPAAADGAARCGAKTGFQSGRERLDLPIRSTDGGVMSDAVKESVRDKVVAILAEQAVLDPAEVRPDATLADLGIDCLGLVEAIFAIEEAFDIQVPFNANDPERLRVRHQHRRHHGPRGREPDRGPEVACAGSSSPARARSTPSAGPPTRPSRRCARAARASAPLEFQDVERLSIPIGGQIRGYRPEEHFSRQELTLYDPFTQFALLAAREAMAQSGLGSARPSPSAPASSSAPRAAA